ncbi:MAG: acyl-CoA dehydrogenase family protein [Planctomycetes bacterium]|nr:acyl-CoA dehydrogenase family protein [Planctomycetota bacterium]
MSSTPLAAASAAAVSAASSPGSTHPASATGGSANFFTDNADLQFQFKQAEDFGRTVPWLENQFKEEGGFAKLDEAVSTYEESLTLVGKWCGAEVAPHAREIDAAECRLEGGEVVLHPAMKANLAQACELGILGVDLPRVWGGWNFPFVVSGMMLEMLARACPATMAQFSFYSAPARLMLRFGTEELKKRFVEPLLSGAQSGAICITESEAGSDVGNVRLRAERKEGEWRLTGRKIFITNGGADQSVVVARTDPASMGLAGLSLFVVPRKLERDGAVVANYRIARIEHKVCIHGSATCELEYENSLGYLLGSEGKGWEEIVSFMNEGRVGVALQSVGLMQAAYNTALAYARERVTMGKPIARHELIADQLVEIDVTVRALRALVYRAAATEDRRRAAECEAGTLPAGDARRVELEREAKRLARYGRELTPLLKYEGAEKCMEVCKRALQMHGGYGVITEYDVERYYRDSTIFTLYEGTSQIQALMCLKDNLKWLFGDLGGFAKRWGRALIGRWLPGGRLARLQARAEGELERAFGSLLLRLLRAQFGAAWSAGKRGKALIAALTQVGEHEGVAYARLSAERLTRILATVHAGRVLRDQAGLSPERARLAEDFLARRLPEVRALAEAVCSGERSAIRFATTP